MGSKKSGFTHTNTHTHTLTHTKLAYDKNRRPTKAWKKWPHKRFDTVKAIFNQYLISKLNTYKFRLPSWVKKVNAFERFHNYGSCSSLCIYIYNCIVPLSNTRMLSCLTADLIYSYPDRFLVSSRYCCYSAQIYLKDNQMKYKVPLAYVYHMEEILNEMTYPNSHFWCVI